MMNLNLGDVSIKLLLHFLKPHVSFQEHESCTFDFSKNEINCWGKVLCTWRLEKNSNVPVFDFTDKRETPTHARKRSLESMFINARLFEAHRVPPEAAEDLVRLGFIEYYLPFFKNKLITAHIEFSREKHAFRARFDGSFEVGDWYSIYGSYNGDFPQMIKEACYRAWAYVLTMSD